MLKRVVASRHSAKAFDTARCEVPEAVLAEVLAVTLVRGGWMGGGALCILVCPTYRAATLNCFP